MRTDIRLRSAQEKQGREVSIHSGSKDQSPWLSLHRADGLFEHEQFQIVSLVLDTVAEHGGARDDEMGDGNAYPLSVINDTYLESRFVESFSFIWGHLENGLDLGAALAECGDLAEAVTAYSEAIRLGVNDQATAAAHDSIGNVRRLLGDPPAAIDAFREAIRLNPDEPHEARYNLSVALAQSDDAVGAITATREAVQRQQPPQAGSFRLLRAIVMSPRPKDAVEALKRVRDDAPTMARFAKRSRSPSASSRNSRSWVSRFRGSFVSRPNATIIPHTATVCACSQPRQRSGQPASPQTRRLPKTWRRRTATSPPVPLPWLPPAKGSISRHWTSWPSLAGESKRSTGSAPTSRTGQNKPRLACLSPWLSCGRLSRAGELTEISRVFAMSPT